MSVLVDIKNLSVSYDGVPVLCNVNLHIGERDFLGVVGGNGGGKTTLLKAILRLVTYSGTIDYADGTRRRIGYLPQLERFDAAFPLPVGELVLSGLQSRNGLTRRYTAADRLRADFLMRSVGIEAIARQTAGNISGGQLQRALFCRAIIARPRLLILDEPANFVDEGFQRQLHEMLRELNRTTAIVMVSHDAQAIAAVAKRIVRVEKGKLLLP